MEGDGTTRQAKDPGDRFGIPDERIIEVIRAHEGLIRDGRCEARSRDAGAAASGLDLVGMVVGSPTELIPTDDRVADVLQILRGRSDADSSDI